MLRIFFKCNRRLRGELCGCALRSLTSYFAAVSYIREDKVLGSLDRLHELMAHTAN
jgi:hypothetical protein